MHHLLSTKGSPQDDHLPSISKDSNNPCLWRQITQNQGSQEELQPPASVVPFNTDEKYLKKISIQDVLLAMN